MRYRFHHISQAPLAQVEDYVREKASLIESRLATFEDDLIELDVRLDYDDKRRRDRRNDANYDGHLVLYLPGNHLKNIGATGHGESWATAINEAFSDLEVQLEKTLAKLHREPDIHDYRHRPSWEREGAELLGEPQDEPNDSQRWMEEWDQRHPTEPRSGNE